MAEVVLSGTVLLGAVLLIRTLLKDRLPAGLRYALWLLVAVRLLVPMEFGTSPASVANWTQGVGRRRFCLGRIPAFASMTRGCPKVPRFQSLCRKTRLPGSRRMEPPRSRGTCPQRGSLP